MDCEWKPYFDDKDENKNTVSLIQLCHHKQCLLIRIQKIINENNGAMPLQLIGLLSNPQIIKTGLNITGDAKKLYEDYHISLRGSVELTHLIKQKCSFYKSINSSKYNIFRLDQVSCLLLNINMEKSKKITLSNWENEPLTTKQIIYAADDAIISYFIFIQCIYNRLFDNVSMIKHTEKLTDDILSFDIYQYLLDKNDNFFLEICYGIIDVKVIKLEQKIDRKKKLKLNSDCKTNDIYDNYAVQLQQQRLLLKEERKKKYRQRASRSKPLYENCQLLDINGHLIANCSTKTLMWYLKKGLADKVNESTVQLKFKAKNNRTSADKFYQTSKKNECVVCGEKECLVKYYVVPQCYRKHFPVSIKAHSSHDIVLLCHDCHQLAAMKEELFRHKLCKIYNINEWNKPIDINKRLMYIAKNAKTYFKCKDILPMDRKNEILDSICSYFNLESYDEVNDDVLQMAIQLIPSKAEMNELKQQQFAKHASQMVNAMNDDYSHLNKTWRQHFLDEMKPQCLPKHWSVDSEY